MKKTLKAEDVVGQIFSETVLTLTQAQNELEKTTGIRPDKSTICRWIKRGLGGVRLEACRIGGHQMFTSIEALNRFAIRRSEGIVNS